MKTIRIFILSLLLCTLCGGIAFAQTAADTTTELHRQQADIKVKNGAVEIYNTTDTPIEVAVFAITGTLVRQETLDSGDSVSIDLSAGYYIIKAGAVSKRVAVK